MVKFLELTLAQKAADANRNRAYVPGEIDSKNFYMDEDVIRRIESVKKDFDVIDDMDENEKSVIAMHIAYHRMKNENLSNPFLARHIQSFKSDGSFVGYYKNRCGTMKVNTLS